MTTSNADEVNRLLAESDSSSGDEGDISGLVGRDAFMDNLLSGSKAGTKPGGVDAGKKPLQQRSFTLTNKSTDR